MTEKICRRCDCIVPDVIDTPVPKEIGKCELCPHCYEFLIDAIKEFLEEWKD